MKDTNKIIRADCIEYMKSMEDNSVDAIVTDPPYLLEFMGKEFDKQHKKLSGNNDGQKMQVWHSFWVKEALRIIKPGGHILAFGGVRTSHRLTSALEDAGWIIRDIFSYMYGSGFPKSQDISKKIDEKMGVEREVIGEKIYGDGKSCHSVSEKAELESAGKCQTGRTTHNLLTKPESDEAKDWDGYGSNLKPAHESIVIAMKPLEGTFAENVLKYGVGGINIDGCRINFSNKDDPRIGKNYSHKAEHGLGIVEKKENSKGEEISLYKSKGRFPSNVILQHHPDCEKIGAKEVEEYSCHKDCPVRILNEQSGIRKSGDNCVRRREGFFIEHGGLGKAGDIQTTYGDSGYASRFFYCAKPAKSERHLGNSFNDHPTLKPIELMRYLCRLIKMPKKTVVLDPFAGSGTTGMAAILEGMDFILIEKDKHYCDISQKRVAWVKEHLEQILMFGIENVLQKLQPPKEDATGGIFDI